MTDTKVSPPFATLEEKIDALRVAVDFRGDVTVQLADQQSCEGYLFNLHEAGANSWIELLPSDGAAARRFRIDELISLQITGKDTAAGKSWQVWLEKVKQAEAAGQIAELYPEELHDAR